MGITKISASDSQQSLEVSKFKELFSAVEKEFGLARDSNLKLEEALLSLKNSSNSAIQSILGNSTTPKEIFVSLNKAGIVANPLAFDSNSISAQMSENTTLAIVDTIRDTEKFLVDQSLPLGFNSPAVLLINQPNSRLGGVSINGIPIVNQSQKSFNRSTIKEEIFGAAANELSHALSTFIRTNYPGEVNYIKSTMLTNSSLETLNIERQNDNVEEFLSYVDNLNFSNSPLREILENSIAEASGHTIPKDYQYSNQFFQASFKSIIGDDQNQFLARVNDKIIEAQKTSNPNIGKVAELVLEDLSKDQLDSLVDTFKLQGSKFRAARDKQLGISLLSKLKLPRKPII